MNTVNVEDWGLATRFWVVREIQSTWMLCFFLASQQGRFFFCCQNTSSLSKFPKRRKNPTQNKTRRGYCSNPSMIRVLKDQGSGTTWELNAIVHHFLQDFPLTPLMLCFTWQCEPSSSICTHKYIKKTNKLSVVSLCVSTSAYVCGNCQHCTARSNWQSVSLLGIQLGI